MNNILVTGGNGFIGSHIISQFDKHYKITVLSRTNNNNTHRLKNFKLQNTQLKIHDFSLEIPFDEKFDYIIHLGGISYNDLSKQPIDFIRNNCIGTLHMLRYAERIQVKKFVYFSSNEGLTNFYGISKTVGEELTKAFKSKFPISIVKTTNVFGEMQHPSKFIPTLIYHFLHNIPFTVNPNLNQKRNFTYVKSIANAIPYILEAEGCEAEVNDEISFDSYELYDYIFGLMNGKNTSFTFEKYFQNTIAWYRQHQEWYNA